MATFTIITNERDNKPPYQIGKLYININYGDSYVFKRTDFENDTLPIYKDPENDPILKIKIISIINTNSGTIKLNGNPISEDDEILMTDIDSGLLIFVPDNTQEVLYNDYFIFDVADTGSGLYGNLEGAINVTVSDIENLPPSQIGDGEATIDHNETLVFTREMFTTQTTPPYSDPEGDAALLLKIATLPDDGVIYLTNVGNNTNIPVIAGQEINFSDIDDGNLIYIPDSSITVSDLENFTFGIADEGSGEFTY